MKFRQSLFWDVDPKTIDPEKNAEYIIERILDLGNDEEVRWMWKRYAKGIIYEVAVHRRGLHPTTRPLWKALTMG